jgi:hypothetical protein
MIAALSGIVRQMQLGGAAALLCLALAGCVAPAPVREQPLQTDTAVQPPPAVATWQSIPVPEASYLPPTFGKRPVAQEAQTKRQRVEALAERLAGSYSSQQQSVEDPEYFDIRLHMTRIWPERTDGAWLYVEQAMAEVQQKPYRQRIYKLSANDDGTLVSQVYELPGDALTFAGAWNNTGKLAGLTPEKLSPRDGCEITLTLNADGNYTGSTRQGACPSALRGASYATSHTTITPDALITWDQGFNDKGEQVWGAVKGGYVFRKQ